MLPTIAQKYSFRNCIIIEAMFHPRNNDSARTYCFSENAWWIVSGIFSSQLSDLFVVVFYKALKNTLYLVSVPSINYEWIGHSLFTVCYNRNDHNKSTLPVVKYSGNTLNIWARQHKAIHNWMPWKLALFSWPLRVHIARRMLFSLLRVVYMKEIGFFKPTSTSIMPFWYTNTVEHNSRLWKSFRLN